MGGVFYHEKKGNKQKSLNTDIIVIRIDKKNNLVNSRPCYNCLDMMKAVGIKKCYYSIDNDIVCERVKNMTSIGASSVMRKLDSQIMRLPSEPIDYYYYLLKNHIPSEIHYKNLVFFIDYNLKVVLPDIKYTINKQYFIIFRDTKIIHKIHIIY